MTVQELINYLDNEDIAYYESGAYYDTSREKWDELTAQALLDNYQISLIEF